MAKKARQAYQYEAPVTPSKWTGEEERFSIRVKAVLEDLYQKFSMLSSKTDDGSGAVRSVNTKEPDENGNVQLGAADVGALPDSGTAADSSRLGGKTLAEIMLAMYPVGSIYLSVNSTSPASLFGGTWERLKDRFLLGAGSSYANGATGGAATHTLTVNEMPSHRHTMESRASAGGHYGYPASSANTSSSIGNLVTDTAGGGASHNNMPPYLAVCMWKRVR